MKIVFLLYIVVLSIFFLSCGADMDRDKDVEDQIALPGISAKELVDTWTLLTIDDVAPEENLIVEEDYIESMLVSLVFVDTDKYTYTMEYGIFEWPALFDVVITGNGVYEVSAGTLTFLTVKWDIWSRSFPENWVDTQVVEKILKEELGIRAGGMHRLEWEYDGNRNGLVMTKTNSPDIGTRYRFIRGAKRSIFDEDLP